MKVEFLGTGGAITIPRPGCMCTVCLQAREKGVPYSRTGPSLFVHGPDVLIDTPEEIKDQINRSQVEDIKACFYSHWHPDHVMGRRVWELNQDFRSWPPTNKQTDIYLPQQVATDFRQRLGTWDHLSFFKEQGLIRMIELKDGDVVEIGPTQIKPFRLAEEYVYAFLFVEEDKKVLIVPDELNNWRPFEEVKNADLAIVPMGVVEFHPLTEERQISQNHPVLKSEATFEETLDIIRQLEAKQVVMTHIEEPDGLSYDDLKEVEGKLQREGLNILFAYDTMIVQP